MKSLQPTFLPPHLAQAKALDDHNDVASILSSQSSNDTSPEEEFHVQNINLNNNNNCNNNNSSSNNYINNIN